MIFDPNQDIDVAFFRQECNGISGLGAVNSALFVIRTAIAAFQITPQVDHFALEAYGVAFGLGDGQETPDR